MERHRQMLLLVAAAWTAAGCLSSNRQEPPFHRDWGRQHEEDSSRQAREDAVRHQEEWRLLKGRKGVPRAAVVTGDNGKPDLRLGGDTGLGCEVDVRGGALNVKVRYKIRWSAAPPKLEEPAQE